MMNHNVSSSSRNDDAWVYRPHESVPSSTRQMSVPRTSTARTETNTTLSSETDYRSIDDTTVDAVSPSPASTSQAATTHLKYAGYAPNDRHHHHHSPTSAPSSPTALTTLKTVATATSVAVAATSPSSPYRSTNKHHHYHSSSPQKPQYNFRRNGDSLSRQPLPSLPIPTSNRSRMNNQRSNNQRTVGNHSDHDDDDDDGIRKYHLDEDGNEIYIVRQNHGYCSYLFSLMQVIVLTIMMWQCGIAPLNIKYVTAKPNVIFDRISCDVCLAFSLNNFYLFFYPHSLSHQSYVWSIS
jgi:hypothetical protein